MSDQYIQSEVAKIVNDSGFEFPKNVAMAAAWLLGNKKGFNLKVLNVNGKSSLADFFILASATNINQAKSMVGDIMTFLRPHGLENYSKEGTADGDWILLDMGDIIIHIFQDHVREFYDLDSLWADTDRVEIPNEYYSSSEEMAEEENTTGYF